MTKFFDEKFTNISLNSELVNKIRKINFYGGQLEVYTEFKLLNLHKMIVPTKLQYIQNYSAVYRNMKITRKKIRELVLENKNPSDIVEDEVSCYRDVLSLIHEEYGSFKLSGEFISEIHFQLFKYKSSSSGSWRTMDLSTSNNRIFRHKIHFYETLHYTEIPESIEQLCIEYNLLCENDKIEPIILITNFIVNLICILPFDNGNAPVARLLFHFLLLRHNHDFLKYYCIDSLIESNSQYYINQALKSCANWKYSEHNIVFWLEAIVNFILESYQNLFTSIELNKKNSNRINNIQGFIRNKKEGFNKNDIRMAFPTVGESTINRIIKTLRENNEIELVSIGRNAIWKLVN